MLILNSTERFSIYNDLIDEAELVHLINEYRGVVKDGRCYHGSVFEWEDALTVRKVIEQLFADPSFIDHPNADILKISLLRIDDELREITKKSIELPYKRFWWERKILSNGQDAYRESMKKVYFMNVEEHE